ncbi:MAG: hypothetical protein AAGA57_11695 [Planctomycetota bacterium]
MQEHNLSDASEPSQFGWDRAVQYIRGLTDKQFVELFYQVAADRNPLEQPQDGTTWLVLAEVTPLTDTQQFDIAYLATPSSKEDWDDEAPICQHGECTNCGAKMYCWSKRAGCPVCGAPTYCT